MSYVFKKGIIKKITTVISTNGNSLSTDIDYGEIAGKEFFKILEDSLYNAETIAAIAEDIFCDDENYIRVPIKSSSVAVGSFSGHLYCEKVK